MSEENKEIIKENEVLYEEPKPVPKTKNTFTGHYCHKCLQKIYEENIKVEKGENNTVSYSHQKCPKKPKKVWPQVIKWMSLIIILTSVFYFAMLIVGKATDLF